MIKKNNILILSLGFIFSIILCGCIYFVNLSSRQANILEELSFYYQSIGELNLSEDFKISNYFFNNMFLYAALLIIPIFRLLNNYIIKSYIFHLQFSFIGIIGVFIVNYEKYVENILYLIIGLIFLISIIRTIVSELRYKNSLYTYEELSQIEKSYNLFLIGLYFFMIIISQNLSDLFVILMIISSLVLTFYIPYVIKKRIKIKSFSFYKPVMFFIVATVIINIINFSIQYNKYTSYYNKFPNSFVFNKNTAFSEYKGELNKDCELRSGGINCSISNLSYIFNNYYFDNATISINTESEINNLNNTDYEFELLFFYTDNISKGHKQDVIKIDDFTTSISDDGYTITINLKNYLNNHNIKDYSFIYPTLYFIDKETNESFNVEISDYSIILTKYQ